ncbi:MAG TPA: hypothetical protein VGD27_16715 [Longimicrobiales bacterium]
MRIWLLLVAWLLLASPIAAQELARVETTARVRIPPYMILESGETSADTLIDGHYLRTVTLHVSANRSWSLQVQRHCSDSCEGITYRVSRPTGRVAHGEAIVVEYVWRSEGRGPRAGEFSYLLIGE